MTILGTIHRQKSASRPGPARWVRYSWRFVAVAITLTLSAGAVNARSGESFDPILYTQTQQIIPYNLPRTWVPAMTLQPPLQNLPISQQVTVWPAMVSYSRIGEGWLKYYIQPDLKLGASYTNSFTFQLNARDSQSHPHQLPDGWYLLQAALLLPSNGNSLARQKLGLSTALSPYERFVSSREMFVHVSGGTANRQITLEIPNLSATTVMNHLYVELTPLQTICRRPNEDEEHECLILGPKGEPDAQKSEVRPMTGYRPFLADVNFVPYLPNGQTTSNAEDRPALPSNDTNLNEYIAKAKLFQRQMQVLVPTSPTPAIFATQEKLKFYALSDSAFQTTASSRPEAESVATYLKRLLNLKTAGTIRLPENSVPAIATLCKILAAQNHFEPSHAELYTCVRKAEQEFRASLITHVYAFDSKKIRNVYKEAMRYSLQKNFMVSRSRSFDTSLSQSPTATLYKLADAMGVPASAFGVNLSWSENNGRAKSESASQSLTTSLDFNVLGFEIPLLKFQRCLEVKPVAHSTLFNASRTSNENGLYICGEIETVENGGRTVLEFYTHAFTHAGDTSLIDAYDPESQTINVSMQGDREISAFYYQTRQSMIDTLHSGGMTQTLILKLKSLLDATPLATRGLIINPVDTGEPWSLISTLLGRQNSAVLGDD